MGKSKIMLVKYNDDDEPLELGKKTKRKETTAVGEEEEIFPQESGSPRVRDAVLNSTIFEKLKKTVDTKSSAFSQFAEMLSSLSDVIHEESVRYVAALRAVGKSRGITADQILSALDVRLQTLLTESQKFSETLDQNKKDLAVFARRLGEKDQAIAALKKQIKLIESEKQDIEKAIDKKQVDSEAGSKDFFYAVEVLKSELEEDRRVTAKYIKNCATGKK